jgi:hypothetical protein
MLLILLVVAGVVVLVVVVVVVVVVGVVLFCQTEVENANWMGEGMGGGEGMRPMHRNLKRN